MTDPLKEMLHRYDHAIVSKGGRSLYGVYRQLKTRSTPVLVAVRFKGEPAPTVWKKYASRKRGRPKHIKLPSRLTGKMLGIIDGADLSEFDEMGW